MYEVQRRTVADLGPERLARAGELGVLRLMLGYDESFCRLLDLEEVLAVVDRTVSPIGPPRKVEPSVLVNETWA